MIILLLDRLGMNLHSITTIHQFHIPIQDSSSQSYPHPQSLACHGRISQSQESSPHLECPRPSSVNLSPYINRVLNNSRQQAKTSTKHIIQLLPMLKEEFPRE